MRCQIQIAAWMLGGATVGSLPSLASAGIEPQAGSPPPRNAEEESAAAASFPEGFTPPWAVHSDTTISGWPIDLAAYEGLPNEDARQHATSLVAGVLEGIRDAPPRRPVPIWLGCGSPEILRSPHLGTRNNAIGVMSKMVNYLDEDGFDLANRSWWLVAHSFGSLDNEPSPIVLLPAPPELPPVSGAEAPLLASIESGAIASGLIPGRTLFFDAGWWVSDPWFQPDPLARVNHIFDVRAAAGSERIFGITSRSRPSPYLDAERLVFDRGGPVTGQPATTPLRLGRFLGSSREGLLGAAAPLGLTNPLRNVVLNEEGASPMSWRAWRIADGFGNMGRYNRHPARRNRPPDLRGQLPFTWSHTRPMACSLIDPTFRGNSLLRLPRPRRLEDQRPPQEELTITEMHWETGHKVWLLIAHPDSEPMSEAFTLAPAVDPIPEGTIYKIIVFDDVKPEELTNALNLVAVPEAGDQATPPNTTDQEPSEAR